MDVLEDDVFRAGEAEAFTTDYTLGALTYNGLVGAHVDRCDGRRIVGH